MPTSSLVLPTVGRGDASPLRRTTTLRSVASSGSLRRRVAPGRPELAVGGRGAAAATVDFRQLTEPSLENREPLCWRFIFLPKWDLLGWDGWLTSWLVGWLVDWKIEAYSEAHPAFCQLRARQQMREALRLPPTPVVVRCFLGASFNHF